ncbi:hypothetical protein [Cognaticolwellia beringensis]|uniref:Uncharacterized protein n=1 Tax=Cognaticolwellia beringensis TaxID=1967665 RepID=A0A222GD35_9GAMM|nr:hypothetical protein [Cognaticolwellia beringensis]ASP47408.1 hypothetical protein B5D82_06335 [Cognaticolwellia beringensis]ASP49805.1 hypothetical protein B5D82_19760 [Cognaticolwellia beringensis]
MSTAKITLTVKAVEIVLQEMIANGERISQYAVEKKAGLSNGALNYKVEEYIELKDRIIKLKMPISDQVPNTSDDIAKRKSKEKKEQNLKDKYRSERDELKEENIYLEAENKELLFQLFKLQQYIEFLQVDGVADMKVLNFSLKSKPV